jgi:DnaJ-class molecular chaperone
MPKDTSKGLKNRYITVMCERCKGEGTLSTGFNIRGAELEPCFVCKGTGKTPNEQGKEILELIGTFGRKR